MIAPGLDVSGVIVDGDFQVANGFLYQCDCVIGVLLQLVMPLCFDALTRTGGGYGVEYCKAPASNMSAIGPKWELDFYWGMFSLPETLFYCTGSNGFLIQLILENWGFTACAWWAFSTALHAIQIATALEM